MDAKYLMVAASPCETKFTNVSALNERGHLSGGEGGKNERAQCSNDY